MTCFNSSRAIVVACFTAVCLASTPSVVSAQTFSSGSTGADGALDLATMACTSYCEVQLPPSGVLNYSTINVPSGKILVFKKNLHNTPVVLLAQGAVTIAGSIFAMSPRAWGANVPEREPGPGGFYGGSQGQPGFGPGGGGAVVHGVWVGPLSLVPLVGGSGGTGCPQPACPNGNGEGSGGGGAIAIASSASIAVTGQILAYSLTPSGGGMGSGGAIRLVANSITASGNFNAGQNGGLGPGSGVVRLEAPAGALTYTGASVPAAVLSTINPAIFSSAPASLSITSVGGYAVPAYAGQRFDTVDILLPTQLPDPIPVVVAAGNIPVGTPVTITFGTTNSGTVMPGVLAGTAQSSSATIQVSGLNRLALAYLFVSATFAVPPSAAQFAASSPDNVVQLRVSSAPGGPSQFAYLRADGSAVEPNTLPAEFLRQFQR